MYQPRTYRHWVRGRDLVAFNVTVKETDLYIRASKNLKSKALRIVTKYRKALEGYIGRHPSFLTALEPLPVGDDAPRIVKLMADSAAKAGVGPMASVAGAIAELVGNELLDFSPEVIIENGGDIFLKSLRNRTVSIYAGTSPLTGKIGLVVEAEHTPLGICTSSGTVGHSLSYGKADAAVVVAPSAALADAAATAIGNTIKEIDDIQKGIDLAMNIEDLKGVLIIKDERIGLWGEIQLCQLDPSESV
jgi:ApbE superfamily uncharacterized protein (UPF0280 family)